MASAFLALVSFLSGFFWVGGVTRQSSKLNQRSLLAREVLLDADPLADNGYKVVMARNITRRALEKLVKV